MLFIFISFCCAYILFINAALAIIMGL